MRNIQKACHSSSVGRNDLHVCFSWRSSAAGASYGRCSASCSSRGCVSVVVLLRPRVHGHLRPFIMPHSHHEPPPLIFRSVLPHHRQLVLFLVLPFCSRPRSVREASGVEQAASGTASAVVCALIFNDALFQLELDALQRMVATLCAALSLLVSSKKKRANLK